MIKHLLALGLAAWAPSLFAESVARPFNDLGYGTVSGRLQSLTMYRDFESKNANGANSTLGVVLNYESPSLAGFSAGLGYNYAGEIYANNTTAILANDDINVLNEGWARYDFAALNLSNTTALVGRKINNSEVFRADDFRQKARSIEALQLETADLPDTRLLIGHAGKMSNWIQAGDHWKFQNFGKVFRLVDKGVTYETDGVTWGELVNRSLGKLEVALFDAYAWDVANLAGARLDWSVAEKTAVLAYYRDETNVGRNAARKSNAFGLSLRQKWGALTLEPGYFGVRGDDLLFQELTTGINHALGASMEICSCQFNGGADTAYLKAVTKIKKTSTTLYALYNYTWHDRVAFDGQELNVVVKQPIVDNLTVAFKGGVGYRDYKTATPNTVDTDARLFITYAF